MKKNDRVRHVLDRDWHGTVTDTNGKHPGWLRVKWTGGQYSWYPPHHLELVPGQEIK